MTQLSSQAYQSISRTVSGTPDISADDQVLLCDTSSGAVVINLLQIPANRWQTTWKLYIIDSTGNAATNNITINAGSGQKINGEDSYVISTNSAYVTVTINGNAKYLCSSSTANPSGNQNAPIALTNAQLLALIAAETVVVGQTYRVTDALMIRYAGDRVAGDLGVVVTGMTTKSVSTNGVGLFYNADYNSMGNYSDVVGYSADLGIWSSVTPAGFTGAGDVVIYNNEHYVNISGSWGTAPNADGVNWSLLARSATTGYILESDFVVYDPTTNIITFRKDKRGNQVDNYSNANYGGQYSIAFFQWGRSQVQNNIVSSQGFMGCTNSYCSFYGNVVDSGGSIIDTTNSTIPAGTYVNNTVSGGGNITILNNRGTISENNIIGGSTLTIDATFGSGCEFIGNTIKGDSHVSFANVQTTTSIITNTIEGQSLLTFSNTMTNTTIEHCQIQGHSTMSGVTLTNCTIHNCAVADTLTVAFASITGLSYDGYSARNGFNNWPWTLDCTDPTVYDLATLTLTVPSASNAIGGKMKLINCTGLVIRIIANNSTQFPIMLYPDNGETVTLTPYAIGAAPAGGLVENQASALGGNLYTGRTNGGDAAEINRFGTINGIQHKYVWQ